MSVTKYNLNQLLVSFIFQFFSWLKTATECWLEIEKPNSLRNTNIYFRPRLQIIGLAQVW